MDIFSSPGLILTVLILAIIGICIAYFLIGAVAKLIIGWFPVGIGFLLMVMMLLGGWVSGLIGILIFIGSIGIANWWHNHPKFIELEEKVETMFLIKDESGMIFAWHKKPKNTNPSDHRINPVAKPLFCKECGSPLDSRALFCGSCGVKR